VRAVLRANGIDHFEFDDGGLIVHPSPTLGGTIVFTEVGVLPPWL
jgi:hypothetical protein